MCHCRRTFPARLGQRCRQESAGFLLEIPFSCHFLESKSSSIQTFLNYLKRVENVVHVLQMNFSFQKSFANCQRLERCENEKSGRRRVASDFRFQQPVILDQRATRTKGGWSKRVSLLHPTPAPFQVALKMSLPHALTCPSLGHKMTKHVCE
jgi:hypothetical protein